MNLTHDDVQAILRIVDATEHVAVVDIVHGDLRVRVMRGVGAPRRGEAGDPSSVSAAASAGVAPTGAADPPDHVVLRAPRLGIFLRAPASEPGQKVRADETVCQIEVLKRSDAVAAGVDGRILEILAEHGTLVEFDQPLFLIDTTRG
jgi:acetyl-CoA carboxylase biotin carboxyl carrier protein